MSLWSKLDERYGDYFPTGSPDDYDPYVLGEDEYFVLGDNRMECADSRIWGAVPRSAIRGRVVLLFFPFNKIRI